MALRLSRDDAGACGGWINGDAADYNSDGMDGFAEKYGDASVFRFRLDGRVYAAVENPDDGYRSCLDEVLVGDWPIANSFQAIPVTCRMSGYVLEMLDRRDGSVLVEVGTVDADDYYPCFVGCFTPPTAGSTGEQT